MKLKLQGVPFVVEDGITPQVVEYGTFNDLVSNIQKENNRLHISVVNGEEGLRIAHELAVEELNCIASMGNLKRKGVGKVLIVECGFNKSILSNKHLEGLNRLARSTCTAILLAYSKEAKILEHLQYINNSTTNSIYKIDRVFSYCKEIKS